MHLYCHDHPDTLSLDTAVADARPGRIVLADTPFYPGGGGQLADRAGVHPRHRRPYAGGRQGPSGGRVRSVVITGVGCVTPIGTGQDGLWEGLRGCRSAVQHITR